MVAAIVLIVFGAFSYWIAAFYLSATEPVPDTGGRYVEGIVGQPRYVNPILSPTNSADEDLVEVVYAGLFGYDSKGRIEKRIAENVETSEDGLTYTVTLRNDVRFHDDYPVTASDVVFTVMAIKDPAYKSPLRANWQGVDVEARDERTVVFTLKKSYSGFLEHLTVGILPKHIWESIQPENFALAEPNLSPVGAGPYRFFDYKKDSSGHVLSYELRAFPEYFLGEPHISKLSFNFYPNEDSMIEAYEKRKEVMGMSPLSSDSGQAFFGRKGVSVKEFHLPRVFAVFFNPVKSVPLAYAEARAALAVATDREALVREALHGEGVAAFSPFLSFMDDHPNIPSIPFDTEAANRMLEESGWKRADDGIRAKGEVRLEFNLTVPDWPELRKTADLLSSQWEVVGARVNVKTLSVSDLNQSVIRPRDYEALLYGEEMRINNPDFFPFWHSSERADPGRNLAMWNEADADDILTTLRGEPDPDKRRELTEKFLRILSEKNPAVFLYSPNVLYVGGDVVKGWNVESANSASCRFSHIEQWHIGTKRVWKK